jgi:hypothetical protein
MQADAGVQARLMSLLPEEAHILAPLRVASVPSDHPYVRHLSPLVDDGIVLRLPDPPVPGAPVGQWWPSPVLTPAWLREQHGRYDVVHVHFGFEHLSAADVEEVVRTLHALDVPLVLTVHDLQNPHLHDQAPYDAALAAMVRGASEVVTLTPGAAAEVRRRFGRHARVLPHPHVVPLERLERPRPPRTGVIGLHRKARANVAADAVLPVLQDVVSSLPGGQLHPGHDHRLSDDELWDHLESLDVLVLPYLFGTHSGFVEACHDLGTPVVAARVGHVAEQHPLHSYDVGDPRSLGAALRRAYVQGPGHKADPEVRSAQRAALAEAHTTLYVRVARAAVAA